MPLCQRPHSLNTYGLSLLWFKCHSLDLREGDSNKMTSIFKSWLYADNLEKPEELVTYRSVREGGLGVHNIKCKSAAILTASFIETAIGDKFIRNNFHNALFRWHVLGEHSIQ